jgi:hypothetical protein
LKNIITPMNQKVLDLYRPLSEHLRTVAIENAFYVIWAYMNLFQFDTPMPANIQVADVVVKNHRFPPGRGVLEWELALLAREMIINGHDNLSTATRNFQDWNYFAAAINGIKDFENNAWPIFGDVSNVMKEVRRIAHRQFPWQTRIGSDLLVRYFKIYNNPRVASVVKNKLGLTVQQWYIAGTAAFGATLSNSKFNIDPNLVVGDVTRKEFDIFFKFVSTDLNNLKKIIAKNVKYDDEFVYTFNPLEYYPLVLIGEYYYCPIINFLAWRITSGIFFNLVGDKNFGHPFGLAFQDYLEEVARKVLDPIKTEVFGEQKYKVGKREEDSIDLILAQKDAAFFMEAKAKRMQAKSKSQLLSDDSVNKDLEILADDIIQVYATIKDYKNGSYIHFQNRPEARIYPLIVTLEDWFLFGSDADVLAKKVEAKLKSSCLPVSYLEEMPYAICCARDFEHLTQILNIHSISEVMGSWLAPEKKGHNFGQFLVTNYQGKYGSMDRFFHGDFERIYPASVMNGGEAKSES